MDDLRLAALLCTRLCHDLIGPAGAVVNGVELLSEEPGAVDNEVLELIRHSATETTRRLKYFRLALGVPGEAQTLAACRVVADEYFESSKAGIDWSDGILATTPPPPSGLIPILLNLIICGAESLPRGGRIAIDSGADNDRFLLRVKASGETIKVDNDALLSLSGKRDLSTLEAHDVVPYMVARLVSAAKGTVEAVPSAESMAFTVSLPIGI